MNLTVVISYYKNLANLKLILKALNTQCNHNFEAIISEDDYNAETTDFVANHQAQYQFPIVHLNQTIDKGFRKNEMLNKSIYISKGDILAFIDGDCIPHKHFVKEYIKHTKKGYILWGRRVMLGQNISTQLLDSENVGKLGFTKLLFSDSQLVKDALYSPHINLTFKQRGLLGCNWAIRKEHLLAINGFDEDYIKPGVGEDVDIEWRLKALGLEMKSMKNKAIVYHMYHPRSYSEDGVQFNYKLLAGKEKTNNFKCLNGIEKF
tara:strand:+ start:75 stop:863 length:789 start_codon:yes stop_codon:yes gene_type:complete